MGMGPCQWSVALQRRQLFTYVKSADSEVIPIFLSVMFRYVKHGKGSQKICQTCLGMFLLSLCLTCIDHILCQ